MKMKAAYMRMKRKFLFKRGINCFDMEYLCPDILIVLGWAVRFCNDNKLDCIITNLIHKFLMSTSDTHPQGRAFDLSVRNWKPKYIEEFIKYMNYNCGHLGAISVKSGERRLVYYHDAGKGSHLHVQVASKL